MFTPVADSLMESLHNAGKVSDEDYNAYMARNRKTEEVYWRFILPSMIIFCIVVAILN